MRVMAPIKIHSSNGVILLKRLTLGSQQRSYLVCHACLQPTLQKTSTAQLFTVHIHNKDASELFDVS
jgi:hypothetical protein